MDASQPSTAHLQLGEETGAEIQCLQMQSNGWGKKLKQTPDFKYICKHTHTEL